MSLITVGIKVVGKPLEFREVENSLETFQTLVDGYIEQLHLGEGIALICNEEGKIENLPENFKIRNDYIVGNAVFISVIDANGHQDAEFHSLGSKQIANLNRVILGK